MPESIRHKSITSRISHLLRRCATPLWHEPAIWICFTGSWVLTTYFLHIPNRKLFVGFTYDLWITVLLVAITARLLPRKLRPWFRVLSCFIFFLSCAIEAFLHERFRLTYNPTMFSLVSETNGQESGEFLNICLHSTEFLHTFGAFLVVGALAFVAQLLLHLPRKVINSASHVLNLTACVLLLALALTSFEPWCQRRSQLYRFLCLSQSGQAERTSSRPYYSSTLRLIYSFKFYHLTLQEASTFSENTQNATLNTLPDSIQSMTTPAKIILVIGESYNKHHAQIYGYDKKTTPNMARMLKNGELKVFQDVVTPWNITSQVFKWLMSTQSVDSGKPWADGVLWPSLFQQAGWQVAFITNQYTPVHTRNKVDFSGSFFLNTQPLDSLAFTHRNHRKYQYDGQLLCELDSLPSPFAGNRNLTIVHLIGQHLDARLRVPSDYWYWNGDNYKREDIDEKARQTLADYDNATRYNDNVFYRLCQRYRNTDAIIIYLSDHGEEIYDGTTLMYGRNHAPHPSEDVIRNEYEVPFVVWTSRSFRRNHPDIERRLLQSRERPFMIDDICHLLLGIAQIPSPFYESSRDLLSDDYDITRPRLIREKIPYK